jgi:hypothetical protein
MVRVVDGAQVLGCADSGVGVASGASKLRTQNLSRCVTVTHRALLKMCGFLAYGQNRERN